MFKKMINDCISTVASENSVNLNPLYTLLFYSLPVLAEFTYTASRPITRRYPLPVTRLVETNMNQKDAKRPVHPDFYFRLELMNLNSDLKSVRLPMTPRQISGSGPGIWGPLLQGWAQGKVFGRDGCCREHVHGLNPSHSLHPARESKPISVGRRRRHERRRRGREREREREQGRGRQWSE